MEMNWIKCSKEAFAKCPYKSKCGSFDDAFFMDGSDCDKFNQSIKPRIIDAVPISELIALRDTLYDTDEITLRGIYRLNKLIAKYDSEEAKHET